MILLVLLAKVRVQTNVMNVQETDFYKMAKNVLKTVKLDLMRINHQTNAKNVMLLVELVLMLGTTNVTDAKKEPF